MKPVTTDDAEIEDLTDLDMFLVRLETCIRHSNWSETEKVFHLMNSLSESASYIEVEVGSGGTIEHILETRHVRFINRTKKARFRLDLHNRRRRPEGTLPELYLEFCELRVNVFSDDPSDCFCEVYIFVDALTDKELRRVILTQTPSTLNVAYKVASELETTKAYLTLVADSSRVKPGFRQLNRELKVSLKFLNVAEKREQVVWYDRCGEMEKFLRNPSEAVVQIESLSDFLIPASYGPRGNFKTISEPMQNQWSRSTGGQSDGIGLVNNHRESQTILQPMEYSWSRKPGGQSDGSEFVNNYRESSDPEINRKTSAGECRCYYWEKYGHFSRDCKKPRRRDERPLRHQNGGSRPKRDPTERSGFAPGTKKGLDSPSEPRREAYLEVHMGERRILALPDSGCEQLVTRRTLIPLKSTRIKFSAFDGTSVFIQLIRSDRQSEDGSTVATGQSCEPMLIATQANSYQPERANAPQPASTSHYLRRCMRQATQLSIKAATTEEIIIYSRTFRLNKLKIMADDKIKSREFVSSSDDSDNNDTQ